jgi:hypothetical protein
MVSIVYKSLSSLAPIELKYEYYRDEELIKDSLEYQEGYSFYETKGLEKYQDVAINRDSCFILTSSIDLEKVFKKETQVNLDQQPSTVILQPRNSFIYFIKHQPVSNTFQLTLTSSSHFFIQPISETKEVELFVDRQYVQVEEDYPFVVKLNNRSLDPEVIHRQRFLIHYENGFISFKTKTNQGYRYLALNNDNILRAVGVIFNDSVVNDYIFKCLPVTDVTSAPGFIPSNNWVTYYFDVESQTENRTLTVNKNIEKIPTNLLVDFPIEEAVETGIAHVNIANLKTNVTPTGGPAPVDNTYTKQVITKN